MPTRSRIARRRGRSLVAARITRPGNARSRRAATGRNHPAPAVHDDLVRRRFASTHPNVLWCPDITEHRTAEGHGYVATVLDSSSRRIVGWSIAGHVRAGLVVDALETAERNGRKEPGTVGHSDRRKPIRAAHLRSSAPAARLPARWAGSLLRSTMRWRSRSGRRCSTSYSTDATGTRVRAGLGGLRVAFEVFYNPIRRYTSAGDLRPVEFGLPSHRRDQRSTINSSKSSGETGQPPTAKSRCYTSQHPRARGRKLQ